MEKIAIIDCGTNTFHLIIVSVNETSYQLETKFKYPVKIGEGGIENQLITDIAQERALNAIHFFKEKIEDYNVSKVKATATSAFRNAKNGSSLKNTILEQTGIDIEIIEGDREAELIYKGVKTSLTVGEKPELIMDIGGGSVEFVLCTNKEIIWKKSFEIGAQRLLDKFQKHDPILKEEVEELNKYLEEVLQPLFQAVEENKTHCLIGSSGTFDTVSEIYYEIEDPSFNIHKDPSWNIPINAFDYAHSLFISKNKKERIQIPGMVPMRVDMIVVASCLIDFVIKKLNIQTIRISSCALKEGLLHEVLDF